MADGLSAEHGAPPPQHDCQPLIPLRYRPPPPPPPNIHVNTIYHTAQCCALDSILHVRCYSNNTALQTLVWLGKFHSMSRGRSLSLSFSKQEVVDGFVFLCRFSSVPTILTAIERTPPPESPGFFRITVWHCESPGSQARAG